MENITKTGEASAASNVTYNHSDSKLDATNVQQAIDEVSSKLIYDVSARNNGAIFESLQALLSSSNLNTLIPTSVRHGGMSIRFIQGSVPSSDNKYVQYRLMTNVWSTAVGDWQGIDDVPTAGSATANAVFSMPNHTFRVMGVAGIMVINFNAATTTATGFEIMVNNVSLPLLASNGEALTALTEGLHIILFDKQNNKLQLIV